ncbi:MAG: AmmeMemoRadiSam system radical SAM enzyme [Candidatus Moraniibacteriota bacterium]
MHLNYKKIDNEKIECLACNHYCKIKNGKAGICGVRVNSNGNINLLVYGKAVVSNIDPIEKKPLYNFLPGSKAFSFGTAGCNFRCFNCQNFDISQIFGLKGDVDRYDEIDLGYSLSPDDIVELAFKNKCKSIAYTYNEPTVFLEYALDTMKLAKRKGLKNVWVSNGFMSKESLEKILPFLDAINIDLKSFENDFYLDNCGARLDPVLENCKKIAKSKTWLEITTLLIPSLTDGKKNIQRLADFIKNDLGENTPWHLSAFSGVISWKLQNYPDTSIEKIREAYLIGLNEGLKYVYAGNISISGMGDTFCSECGELLIKRKGFEIIRRDKQGRCLKCGNYLSGIY